jgi:hypothetical protein
LRDNVGAHNLISSFVPRGIPIGALPETEEPPLSLHSSIFSPQAHSVVARAWPVKKIPKMIFCVYHEMKIRSSSEHKIGPVRAQTVTEVGQLLVNQL